MLAGEAVVAIWNGLAPEARAAFYDWHLHEHIPERVGIPGFRRGRRYVAADAATFPEFFTLYEADTMQVLQGVDYANRLNAPTPATRAVTAQFRDTARALAAVVQSHGPGGGGALLTLRLDAEAASLAALGALVAAAARAPRVTGAHLCQGDAAASSVRSNESRDRDDLQAPPALFILVEATDIAALAPLLDDAALAGAVGRLPCARGHYRLEYSRGKTAWATD
jgi:hypothetical protein